MCGIKILKEMAWSVNGDLIPRFDRLRWVPIRYRRVLPLKIMQRYQCAVIGIARGVLTVAMIEPQNRSAIATIRKLTGRTIFPVSVDPARMRLLLDRIERDERYRSARRRSYSLRKFRVHALLLTIMSVGEKKP